jgi:hypothetical protein
MVSEHSPNLADGGLQYRVADELVAPNFVKQRVLGEQGAGSSCERAEQREWPWRDSDGPSVAQQEGIRLVQFKCVEAHVYRIEANWECGLCTGDSAMRVERNDLRSIHS